jgi:hypothetical protein
MPALRWRHRRPPQCRSGPRPALLYFAARTLLGRTGCTLFTRFASKFTEALRLSLCAHAGILSPRPRSPKKRASDPSFRGPLIRRSKRQHIRHSERQRGICFLPSLSLLERLRFLGTHPVILSGAVLPVMRPSGKGNPWVEEGGDLKPRHSCPAHYGGEVLTTLVAALKLSREVVMLSRCPGTAPVSLQKSCRKSRKLNLDSTFTCSSHGASVMVGEREE